MAQWYSTSFQTIDKDILDVIKNGQTIDFDYDEQTGCGFCRLAYGIASFDIDKVIEIATQNKSSFDIYAVDIYTETNQQWVFKDGVEILAKSWNTSEYEG